MVFILKSETYMEKKSTAIVVLVCNSSDLSVLAVFQKSTALKEQLIENLKTTLPPENQA